MRIGTIPASARAVQASVPWLLVAAALLLAARIWVAFTLHVNSDETQHLHIVWCWTQGILPYRDVFDNHAPLFHILHAPLLNLLGERADIVPLMRLSVIPWYALTVFLTFRLGEVLYSRGIGLAAAVLVAVQPTFFSCSAEFRPDSAWAAAWTAAMLMAVGGPMDTRRAFGVGALAGLAVAFSIKSALLITAALVAAGIVLLALAIQRRGPGWLATLRLAAATSLGGAILPVSIANAFMAVGAGGAMFYCLFQHNAAAGLGHWSNAGARGWLFPMMLPVLGFAVHRGLDGNADPLQGGSRAWVVATALVYLVLRASYQPLLDRQDLLPFVPMIAPFVAKLLLDVRVTVRRHVVPAAAFGTVLACEVALALAATRPWSNQARQYERELGTLLRLSRIGDCVMDDMGESIFRQRPSYWILENVTVYRLLHVLMPDELVRDLIDKGVMAGVFARETGADRQFIHDNYVAVAPRVDVSGKLFGAARAGVPIAFRIELPGRYAILARRGPGTGVLDGVVYTAPRFLAAGVHEFVPARDDEWALEWERAARAGFSPFAAATPGRDAASGGVAATGSSAASPP